MKLKSFLMVTISLTLVACSSPTVSLPAAATPTEPSGTIIKDDGQGLLLTHPDFYWTLKLPRDWAITADTGFEISANNPDKTAFMHLLSQTWLTKDRKPTARAYVDYWKNSAFGDIFPIFADGDLVSETEISRDKYGGPYLRYEFIDGKKDLHYAQIYASSGGPNSIILTVWTMNADYPTVQTTLENILNSVELVQQ